MQIIFLGEASRLWCGIFCFCQWERQPKIHLFFLHIFGFNLQIQMLPTFMVLAMNIVCKSSGSLSTLWQGRKRISCMSFLLLRYIISVHFSSFHSLGKLRGTWLNVISNNKWRKDPLRIACWCVTHTIWCTKYTQLLQQAKNLSKQIVLNITKPKARNSCDA